MLTFNSKRYNKKSNNTFIIKKLIFYPLIFPFLANAILPAITSNKIKGNAPIFISNKAKDNLGFTVNGTFYSDKLGNLPQFFNKNLTINDFKVKTVTNSDFSPLNDYYDEDGDEAKTSGNGTFSIGTITFNWKDNSGKVIPKSDYTKTIGCGSNFSMPLNLEITVSDIQVHSEYGIPQDSDLNKLIKTYQILPKSEICFAKPNQMIVNNQQTWASVRPILYNGKTECILAGYNDNELNLSITDSNRGNKGWNYLGYEYRDTTCGGGYDHTVFDPQNGFYASINPKFPTTGFAGAKFQLIMTGAQTDWDFSVNSNPLGSVTVDPNGNVYLNSKPNGTVTILAKFKQNLSIIHTYNFNPTKIWVIPNGNTSYTYTQAVNLCNGEANIPTRAEMTNSPNAPASWTTYPKTWDVFTRTINEGLLSEWGMTFKENYPDSNWPNGYSGTWFHSSDIFPDAYLYPGLQDSRYAIDAWIGQIEVWKQGELLHTVCKG
ncbi:hypothetical protein A9G11_04435 [Gilliamella sp. wkB108]|uniref:hypothetical protein n=1 Tax=Gilliamella sp. wkB108 TaxID=3120256 RepID=UPI00080E1B4D|nr:hypothetical protein [Gilliamella apicola]OCG23884.1 hypothetical protein A9G11_04435 [Gilliamella apicola]